MNPTDLAFTSALEQARLIREKVISPLELTQLYLDRIERLDPQLGAFFHVAAEQALQDAQAKTEQITQRSADLPPFFGVPTGIKDLNSVKDMPCCYGVKLLRNRIASQDDLVTTKMKQAGFVILGKTSTSQLGALPYVEPPGFAPTRTPWNLAYSAGGSSGGAGAAVAAGLCAVAPGTDGGGSVRIPAACCGLVGLKPSRGRVSCAPVDEYFSGCVVSGTLARSVADAAALLDVLAGYEVGDPYWLPNPNTSFLDATQHDPGKLRIGFATQIPPLGDASADCREAVLKTAHLLESIGHAVEPMEFGAFEFGEMIEPFRLVWQIHSDVGIPGIFLEKVNRDLWFKAQFFRAGKYIQVRQRLYAFARQVVQVCQPYDLVVLPTLMYPDLQVGAWKRLSAQQILQKVIHWIAPCPAFNVSGQPAIALPMGFTPAGIPVSVQLVGRPAAESSLIAVAKQLETIVDWQQQRPTIAL